MNRDLVFPRWPIPSAAATPNIHPPSSVDINSKPLQPTFLTYSLQSNIVTSSLTWCNLYDFVIRDLQFKWIWNLC